MAISPEQRSSAIEILLSREEILLTVSGNSMAPVLKKGDRITIERCTYTDTRPGDIVLCKLNNMLRVHRLIKHFKTKKEYGRYPSDTNLLVTCGDAFLRCDYPVPVDSVCGKAVKRIRDGKEKNLCGVGDYLKGKLIVLRGRFSFFLFKTQNAETSDVFSNT